MIWILGVGNMSITFNQKNLRLRRGQAAGLPILEEAELAYTTDERKVYIGSVIGNIALGTEEDTVNKIKVHKEESNAHEVSQIIGAVANTDTRLADNRFPLPHNQEWNTITNTPYTINGFNIQDAYVKTEIDSKDSAVLSSAKLYTDDTKVSVLATARADIYDAKSDANAYTDTAKITAVSIASSDATVKANVAKSDAITSANLYTDNAKVSANAYADSTSVINALIFGG